MSLISDCKVQMLGALGETDITVLPAWLQARLLNDLNAVGQFIYANSPGSWWANNPNGDTILAPVTLSSMTVTAASKSFSGSGLTARMHGCTVQVSGQTTQNRIFQTGASTWEFLMPHNGTSVANATITVYHDCLNLPEASLDIQRLVMLEGLWELLPLETSADLALPGWARFSSHGPIPVGSYPVSGRDRQSATPTHYLVDGTQLYGGAFILQIRLNPLPDAAYQLNWIENARFTKATSFADARTTIIPHAYEESVLIPLLIERLIDLGNFQGDKGVTIERADAARKQLETLSNPGTARDVYVSVECGW